MERGRREGKGIWMYLRVLRVFGGMDFEVFGNGRGWLIKAGMIKIKWLLEGLALFLVPITSALNTHNYVRYV